MIAPYRPNDPVAPPQPKGFQVANSTKPPKITDDLKQMKKLRWQFKMSSLTSISHNITSQEVSKEDSAVIQDDWVDLFNPSQRAAHPEP